MSLPAELISCTRFLPSKFSRRASITALDRAQACTLHTKARSLATVRNLPRTPSEAWFTPSIPRGNIQPLDPNQPNVPPDERTLKLGKSKSTALVLKRLDVNIPLALRILQERLPTLLQSPLPQDILSPYISLHLFPSTHPHLPTVSGRVAYTAALWTSPIAFGRVPHVPVVSNVQLEILSERMVKPPSRSYSTQSSSTRQEQLIVRWRTKGKTKNKGIASRENVDKITQWLGGGKGEDDRQEFTGLFVFEFDEEGRIVVHTIEHVQEGGNWEKGVGARVVGLTDWLLGGMRNGQWRGEEEGPLPTYCREHRTTGGTFMRRQ